MKFFMKNESNKSTDKTTGLKKLAGKIIMIFSFVFVFAGCSNLLFSDSDSNYFNFLIAKKSVVRVSINESLFAKTARPGKEQFTGLTYDVKAEKDVFFINPSTQIGNVYQMELSEGTWLVTVTGKKDGTEVVKGEQYVTVGSDGTYSCVITPRYITNGSGRINLPITVPAGYVVKAYCSDIHDLNTEQIVSDNSLSVDTVTAGNYVITLGIYKREDGSEYLVYKTSQAINVFANCTTDKWVKSSDTDIFINESGTFAINETNLKTVLDRNVYIASTASTTAGDDTTGDGSYNKPYASINKAMAKITALHGGSDTEEYRIIVKAGTVSVPSGTLINLAPGGTQTIRLAIIGENKGNSILNCEVSTGLGLDSSTTDVSFTLQDITVRSSVAEEVDVIKIGEGSTLKIINSDINNTSPTGKCCVNIGGNINSSLIVSSSEVDKIVSDAVNNNLNNVTINKELQIGTSSNTYDGNRSCVLTKITNKGSGNSCNIKAKDITVDEVDMTVVSSTLKFILLGTLDAKTLNCENFYLNKQNSSGTAKIEELICKTALNQAEFIGILSDTIQLYGTIKCKTITATSCTLSVYGTVKGVDSTKPTVQVNAGVGSTSQLDLHKTTTGNNYETGLNVSVIDGYSGYCAVLTDYGTVDETKITCEDTGFYLDFNVEGFVGKGVLKKSGFELKNNNYSYKIEYTGNGFTDLSSLGNGFYELDYTNNPTGSLTVKVSRKDNNITGSDYLDITEALKPSADANFTVVLKYQNTALITMDGTAGQTRGVLPYNLLGTLPKNTYYNLEVSFKDIGIEHHTSSIVLVK